jgi:mono/diheme cytochrome c family protein
MLFALSTGHEVGLALTGGIFILFALLSSFVFPRFNPDFPSRKGLRWYLPLSACFFAAMLAAVLVFGREKKEASAATPPAATSAPPTTTAPSSSGGASAAPSAPYADGDPTAGKSVFSSAGCSACHTFKPAGSTGTVGPNLDDLASYAQQAGEPLGDYTVDAIIHPPAKYVPPGFPTNAMPTTFGSSLSDKQIADLVAFLDSSSG